MTIITIAGWTNEINAITITTPERVTDEHITMIDTVMMDTPERVMDEIYIMEWVPVTPERVIEDTKHMTKTENSKR